VPTYIVLVFIFVAPVPFQCVDSIPTNSSGWK
jgi:hypothetical protein